MHEWKHTMPKRDFQRTYHSCADLTGHFNNGIKIIVHVEYISMTLLS